MGSAQQLADRRSDGSGGRGQSITDPAPGERLMASDIVGKIYARITRKCQLAAAASELMQSAKGRDLEELFPDSIQPLSCVVRQG